jgi:nitrate/TMAO reductase-like tetraheme cytochrome c subunit
MNAIRILAAVVVVGAGVAALTLVSEPEGDAEGQTSGFTSPAQCVDCHTAIAKEQDASWHGKAWTDPDTLQLSKNFQDEQCISCHAPAPIFQTGVGERVFSRRERRETGVDCLSCHLREDGTVAGVRGLSNAECNPVKEPRLGRAIFCAGCHNQHWTVDEFMAWKAETGRPETCNDCHMPREDRPIADGGPVRKGVASHAFIGGHHPPMMREGLSLEAEVVSGRLVVRVTNIGAGHKIPTDSRHKSVNLLVTVRDDAGNLLAEQEEIAEYRLYYRDQQKESTQLHPGETRAHEYELPADRSGSVLVELVYLLKPPQKLTKDWTEVHSLTVDF